MKAWVEAQIKGGRYATSSDYVRDLIRRDQEYREKLRRLQSAIDDGRDSGLSDRTPEDILAAAKTELRDDS
jgi:antitoxin ParD1/3/4